MRQKPKVCHPSCGLSRRFRGFGYTLNTTATCTYSKASIPATASRPSSQRMKVPTQDELTSLLHTKSKARHPDGPSETGTPGRIRTCDPLLRRQVLYPTELRALVWFGGRLERVSDEPWTWRPSSTRASSSQGAFCKIRICTWPAMGFPLGARASRPHSCKGAAPAPVGR